MLILLAIVAVRVSGTGVAVKCGSTVPGELSVVALRSGSSFHFVSCRGPAASSPSASSCAGDTCTFTPGFGTGVNYVVQSVWHAHFDTGVGTCQGDTPSTPTQCIGTVGASFTTYTVQHSALYNFMLVDATATPSMCVQGLVATGLQSLPATPNFQACTQTGSASFWNPILGTTSTSYPLTPISNTLRVTAVGPLNQAPSSGVLWRASITTAGWMFSHPTVLQPEPSPGTPSDFATPIFTEGCYGGTSCEVSLPADDVTAGTPFAFVFHMAPTVAFPFVSILCPVYFAASAEEMILMVDGSPTFAPADMSCTYGVATATAALTCAGPVCMFANTDASEYALQAMSGAHFGAGHPAASCDGVDVAKTTTCVSTAAVIHEVVYDIDSNFLVITAGSLTVGDPGVALHVSAALQTPPTLPNVEVGLTYGSWTSPLGSSSSAHAVFASKRGWIAVGPLAANTPANDPTWTVDIPALHSVTYVSTRNSGMDVTDCVGGIRCVVKRTAGRPDKPFTFRLRLQTALPPDTTGVQVQCFGTSVAAQTEFAFRWATSSNYYDYRVKCREFQEQFTDATVRWSFSAGFMNTILLPAGVKYTIFVLSSGHFGHGAEVETEALCYGPRLQIGSCDGIVPQGRFARYKYYHNFDSTYFSLLAALNVGVATGKVWGASQSAPTTPNYAISRTDSWFNPVAGSTYTYPPCSKIASHVGLVVAGPFTWVSVNTAKIISFIMDPPSYISGGVIWGVSFSFPPSGATIILYRQIGYHFGSVLSISGGPAGSPVPPPACVSPPIERPPGVTILCDGTSNTLISEYSLTLFDGSTPVEYRITCSDAATSVPPLTLADPDRQCDKTFCTFKLEPGAQYIVMARTAGHFGRGLMSASCSGPPFMRGTCTGAAPAAHYAQYIFTYDPDSNYLVVDVSTLAPVPGGVWQGSVRVGTQSYPNRGNLGVSGATLTWTGPQGSTTRYAASFQSDVGIVAVGPVVLANSGNLLWSV